MKNRTAGPYGLSCFAAVSLASVAHGGPWNIEAAAGQWVAQSSLALDAGGSPIIAMAGRDLQLARWDGSAWAAEVLEDGCFLAVSLKLDAAGDPVLSYIDGSTGELRFARWSGASWDFEVVDSGVGTARHLVTSLALDAVGNPAIAYQFPPSDLKYARWNGATWQLEVVDDVGNVGGEPSLVLDGAGNPSISYTDATNRALKYARWTGAAWAIETVDPDGFSVVNSSLAWDRAGNPAISYHDGYKVKYARWSGSAWTLQIADPAAAGGTSLAFDGLGMPVIGIGGATGLRLARWGGASWSIELVDASGNSPSLALDTADRPALSYNLYRTVNDPPFVDLKHARWTGSTWVTTVVESAHVPGDELSLALDPAGRPALAYYSATSRDLLHTYRTGTGWVTETVDNNGAVGKYPSLAIDEAGVPHVAYLSWRSTGPTDSLSYAYRPSSTWIIERIDNLGDVGAWASLALDPTGNPGIAYYDTTGRRLKYAHRSGGIWSVEVVDDIAWVGEWCSLAFDSTGSPAISYRQDNDDDLKFARWNGTSWTIETVVWLDKQGWFTSLSFDASDRPSIAYGELVSSVPEDYDLKLARWTGNAWAIETVDSASNLGDRVSLKLDHFGQPAIAYQDRTSSHVKYARWSGGTWRIESVDQRLPMWRPDLALDARGIPSVAYFGSCAVRVATLKVPDAALYRGVSDLLANWRSVALPLTDANDDATAPFPVATVTGGWDADPAPPAAALTLYRALSATMGDTGNVLRVVKSATSVGAVEVLH